MNETTVTTPNELEIRVERILDAPRAHVFSVWTDPQLIPEWWGDGTVVEEMDVRPGGSYRFRTAHGVLEGEFHWHKHDETDDFFLVLKGRLTIQIAHPRSGRTRLRGHQGRVQVHQGAVPRPGQERHAGVRGLCVGQLVYGARPFAAQSMGVVRPK